MGRAIWHAFANNSDHGPQFRSDLFLELTKLLGAQDIKTTSYNPEGNGLIERFHRRLKELLMIYSHNWFCYLPAIRLGLRSVPRDDSGVSCSKMTFGQKLRLPGELYQSTAEPTDNSQFVKHLREILRELRPAPFKHKDRRKIFVHKDLSTCRQVYVRVDKVRVSLEPPYEGPYKVIARKKHYFVLLINGIEDTVSINRLKPAYELDAQIIEGTETDRKLNTPTSILKNSGSTQPLQEGEGDVVTNTQLNSRRLIYVSDDDPPVQPIEIPEPLPLEVENLIPHINLPLPEQGAQNFVRRSGRVIRPPVRFSEYVT